MVIPIFDCFWPPQDDEDETFPAHIIDQSGIIRDVINNYVLRYDAVLDPAMLHDSLAALLRTGEWRKLGGRLRLNVNLSPTLALPYPGKPYAYHLQTRELTRSRKTTNWRSKFLESSQPNDRRWAFRRLALMSRSICIR